MAKRYFKEYKLVASEVARNVKILKETSCMSPERRFQLACCIAFREHFSKDKEFNKFLKEVAEPTLAKLGHSEWNRDVLTDLGFRISLKRGKASLKDLQQDESP